MRMERAIGHLSLIPAGEGRTFAIDGLRIAVFHSRDGAVFATQADCPHRGGPLADGLTDADSVVCPLHDRVYNLRTGAASVPGCDIRVYPARCDDRGIVLVASG